MKSLHGLLCTAGLLVSAGALASDAATLKELEHRLAQLELESTDTTSSDWTDRVSINGFITYGLARHDVHENQGPGMAFPNPEQGESYYYLDTLGDEVSHRELSRVGLQFDARINDKTSAVIQILGQAGDNYDAEVQWAYLDYELLPGLHWRGGRLVLPTFMHSQYLNVGYAYHWASLPAEIYGTVPFDTFDGMDLTWSFNTGPLSHEASAFYGGVDLEDGNPPVSRYAWIAFSAALAAKVSPVSSTSGASGATESRVTAWRPNGAIMSVNSRTLWELRVAKTSGFTAFFRSQAVES